MIRNALIGFVAAIALCACSSNVGDSAGMGAKGDGKLFRDIPGEIPNSNIVNVKGEEYAPVGACVNLSGIERNSNFKLVDCSSDGVNYRIIQRVNWPTECVKDADRIFYHNDRQGYEWVACMDLAWSPEYCLSITPKLVKNVRCDDTTAVNRQRPTDLLVNTATVDDCPAQGFAHPVRRFTVCTETQK